MKQAIKRLSADKDFRRRAVQWGCLFALSVAGAAAQTTNVGRGLNNAWSEVQTWTLPIGGIGLLGGLAAGHWGEGGVKRHAGKAVVSSALLLGVVGILNTIQQWSQ